MICSLIEFGTFFSQGLMGNQGRMLGSSRSPMEERDKGTLLFLDELNEWEREERHWEGRGKV